MDPFEQLIEFATDTKTFAIELIGFITKKFTASFLHLEKGKGIFARALYIQRGKYARRLMHSSMAILAAVGVAIAPAIAQEFPGTSVNPWELSSTTSVLSAATSNTTATHISDKQRGEIIEYTVMEGDTLSTIAEKFGVSEETVMWQNNLTKRTKIKTGQTLEILPITGISHKVRKGDTVYSIAKKYDVDPQEIVNFPFNTYVNDETFALAIGQELIVPSGVKPAVTTTPRTRRLTPNAGTVVASGQFVWPTSGRITQNFIWYHKALDIANKSAPNILAADSGTVIVAGWPDGFGYGNRIIIDHGNGYKTLYAHLSSISVRAGQTVARGNIIGRMGSTGRSTGTHLHFEVIRNGINLNPLGVLR